MIKKKFISRNMVAIAICLAGFLSANNALAQTFNYTDASGVNYTFEPTTREGVDIVKLTTFTLPSSVTKWVMPETVTNNNVTYLFTDITAYTWDEYNLRSATLREIVFPNTMTHAGGRVSNVTFPQLHKVTFGRNVSSAFTDFLNVPLDTVILLGTGIIWGDGEGGTELYNAFEGCPATTKIFIPCGTMQQFLTAFASSYTTWDEENGWTSANFIENPCLNTLTVLSSDNALGDAWSVNSVSGVVITFTPDHTSAPYNAYAYLLALPKGGKVFLGWNDGNLDNPRVVNVTADVTYTANFATCSGAGVEEVGALRATPLQVFPNPANNALNVELERQANGTLALFDLGGKIVLSQAINGNSAQINLSALTAGNYILRLVENGQASAGVQLVKK